MSLPATPEVVDALRKDGFYVQDGNQGDRTYLKGVVYPGLGLVILNDGPDPSAIVPFTQAVSSATGMTVAVQAGNARAAYSPINPDKATDTLERAVSIATNNRDVARVFARDARSWAYVALPEPTAPTTTPAVHGPREDSGTNWALIGGGGFIAAAAAGGVLWAVNKRKTRMEDIAIGAVPPPVREGLEDLIRLRVRVTSPSLKADIAQICNDLGFLFKINPYTKKEMIAHNVVNARKVIEQYLAIQDVPKRYSVNGPNLMKQAERSIHEFGEAVLQMARRNNGETLADFQINTEILSAARDSLNEGA